MARYRKEYVPCRCGKRDTNTEDVKECVCINAVVNQDVREFGTKIIPRLCRAIRTRSPDKSAAQTNSN